MSPSPQLLSIDQVESGMTLGEDLRDAGGDVLLPRGATLTTPMLAALRRRGIDALPIAQGDDAAQTSPADLASLHERSRERISALFRRCDTGETGATATLRRCLTRMLTEPSA